MHLSFMKTYPETDNKTHFPEKILAGIYRQKLPVEWTRDQRSEILVSYLKSSYRNEVIDATFCPTLLELVATYKSKLHTIRASADKWREGLDVQFVTGPMFKKFQFAPSVPFVSKQDIVLRVDSEVHVSRATIEDLRIQVDQKELSALEKKRLLENDGLDLYECLWFFFDVDEYMVQPSRWFGSLIHWTSLRY